MVLGSELIKEIEETTLPTGQMAFWWLGQMGYAYKIAGKVVFVDPYLGEDDARIYPPVFHAGQASCVDYVIGTHDHDDHINYATWKAIANASPQARFLCSQLYVDRLSETIGIPRERFLGLQDGKTVDVGAIRISGVAAAHEKLDQDDATGLYPYLGVVIQGDGVSLYHAGDTCIYDGMTEKLRAYGTLDAIFLPINGRSGYKLSVNCIGNMTFQEAVDLTGALCPKLVVPAHFEMHAINLGNPLLFYHNIRVKYPGIDCWLGSHGEKVVVQGGAGMIFGSRWPQ